MYGESNVLITKSPFIVVTSNKMPEASWGVDRWKIYNLVDIKGKTNEGYQDKDLTDITEERIERVNKHMRVARELEEKSLQLKELKLKNI